MENQVRICFAPLQTEARRQQLASRQPRANEFANDLIKHRNRAGRQAGENEV
jgi:hypothetical protein